MTCDIDTQTFSFTGRGWIGYDINRKTILFAKDCMFCPKIPRYLQLNMSDTQCIGHRTGLQCGVCPTGLSAVLGSFNCKKCSNDMLWLLPVFFIAGILLVFCLFTLNMTVVDGKINGFIAYANITIAIGYYAFPSKNSLLYVILSISNLDLGIETCFYRGMTEYDKTWLQFAFPLYLLCIAGVLAITSRYFSFVERLTRKRVIPVIATIFLLSYNKILLVTITVLFYYTSVIEIDRNKTEKKLVWMWDTHVSAFEIKFILLFIVCLLVVVFILLPLNFLLLFTRLSYKCRLVSKYLKPFLDAYQAPLKVNHYYYFGIELLIRPVLFALNNGMLSVNETWAIYIIIWVMYLLYLSSFKPFRCNATRLLYISYTINLGCQVMLVAYYNANPANSTLFKNFYMTLAAIALVEFGCTVLYYLYISHLYKIAIISKFKTQVSMVMIKLRRRFASRSKDPALTMEQLTRYEQLQEELIVADPNK